MKKILNGVCMILCILAVCSLMTEPVLASETRASEEENDVYDALQESIR